MFRNVYNIVINLVLIKWTESYDKENFVSGVPSTGISSALGFAEKLNLQSVQGLVKTKNSNRTFILQDDQNRNDAASKKYIVNK